MFNISWIWSFIFLVLSCGCTAQEQEQEDLPEIRKPRPRPLLKDDPWFDKRVVAQGGQGLHAQLSTSLQGEVGVAYWATDGVEGEACELETDSPLLEVRWDLSYSSFSENQGWEAQRVAQPLVLGTPPGLFLEYNAQGFPEILAVAGEIVPEIRYCGGSDLGLFTPPQDVEQDEWDVQWVVEESNQAMSGEQASDYGSVVGHWPSMATSESGKRMVVYRDVHGGSLQRDDLYRADLEVAFQSQAGGSWTYEVIDLGQGGGIYNQAFYVGETPMVIYYLPVEATQEERSRQGIWIARRKSNGEWEKGLISGGPTQGAPSVWVDEEGIFVLYSDPTARRPVLATLENIALLSDSSAWKRTPLGDLRYNEGHSPTLKRNPITQSLVASWYRCGPADSQTCQASTDGAVFAWQGSDTKWNYEIVETGEEALCGFSPDLTFDLQGQAWMVWQCSRRVGQGLFEYRLESARRTAFDPSDFASEESEESNSSENNEESNSEEN